MNEVQREKLDVAIIGGGVVGLALARAFADQGREVALFERQTAIGTETSSRNSEVVHSGMYYDTGSLKATLSVSGRTQLYAYCDAKGISYQKIGKLVVASREEEIPILEKLKRQGEINGVDGLSFVSKDQITEMEPSVHCEAALFSSETGIIDSHALMKSLQQDAVSDGAMMVMNAPIIGGKIEDNGIALTVGGRDPMEVICTTVINSAGLYAQDIARTIEGFPTEKVPGSYYAKGHYFVLSQKSPFSHLIYPVPEPGGLGIHVTLDLAGNARFGPDVSWTPTVEYSFDMNRKEAFYTAIRKYYPALSEEKLVPGYTGIRPKIASPTEGARDFLIQGPTDHGINGMINLFGIESPGLTSCLAIARYVSELAK